MDLNLRDIPPQLIRQLKKGAFDRDITLKEYCVRLLSQTLLPLTELQTNTSPKSTEAITSGKVHHGRKQAKAKVEAVKEEAGPSPVEDNEVVREDRQIISMDEFGEDF